MNQNQENLPPYSPLPYPEQIPTPVPSFDYIDITTIPNTHIIYQTSIPVLSQLSNAKITIASNMNISSYDPILDSNPDELWKFFLSSTCISSPRIKIRIIGTETTSSGENQETTTHFVFSVPISHFIEPTWKSLYTVSDPTNKLVGDFKVFLEAYAKSKNLFKSISMIKQIDWNFERLRLAIIKVVRSTGFRHDIQVIFEKQNFKVTARSSSPVSKLSQDNCCKCLCFISCLCLIGFPLLMLFRKKLGARLVLHFDTTVSEEDFFNMNRFIIFNKVRRKVINRT